MTRTTVMLSCLPEKQWSQWVNGILQIRRVKGCLEEEWWKWIPDMPSLAELKGHLTRSPVGYRRDRSPITFSIRRKWWTWFVLMCSTTQSNWRLFRGLLENHLIMLKHTLNFTFRKLSLNHLLNVKETIQEWGNTCPEQFIPFWISGYQRK